MSHLNEERRVTIDRKPKVIAILGRNNLIWSFAAIMTVFCVVLGVFDLIVEGVPPYTITSTDINGQEITKTIKSDTLETLFGGIFQSTGETFIPYLDFNDFLAFSLMIFIGVPAFFIYYLDNKKRYAIDRNLPYLLREIATAQRTGMALPRAVAEASKRDYGPLGPELKKLAAKLTWGIPFNRAMLSFRDAVSTPLSKQATLLIIEAERSGGQLEQIFEAARSHVQELLNIKEDRIGQIRPYIYIVYAAFLILSGVVVILFYTFFFAFADPAASTTNFQIDVDVPLYRILFLHLILIEAIFAGLIAGKMIEGRSISGLHHSAILIGIGWLIFKVGVGLQ